MPRFSKLPRDIQLDVRSFFATYTRACERANALLFSAGERTTVDDACRRSSVGKDTPSSLYVHTSALSNLQPVLRVYEGCAKALVGNVEGANIIKLHKNEPKISYLAYPDFDGDPHPALLGSLTVHLQTFRIKYREYKDSPNPPILHRKEEFITEDHPLRAKFARLTNQEERWGLYEKPEFIGTKEGWKMVLCEHKARIAGHRLLRNQQLNEIS